MSCIFVDRYQRFGETFYVHFQCRKDGEYLSERRIFATEFVDESETHVLYTAHFARKFYGLRELKNERERTRIVTVCATKANLFEHYT